MEVILGSTSQGAEQERTQKQVEHVTVESSERASGLTLTWAGIWTLLQATSGELVQGYCR